MSYADMLRGSASTQLAGAFNLNVAPSCAARDACQSEAMQKFAQKSPEFAAANQACVSKYQASCEQELQHQPAHNVAMSYLAGIAPFAVAGALGGALFGGAKGAVIGAVALPVGATLIAGLSLRKMT